MWSSREEVLSWHFTGVGIDLCKGNWDLLVVGVGGVKYIRIVEIMMG